MKLTKILAFTAAMLLAPLALAAEHAELQSFRIDTTNLASVQRGARDFMSYCSGCHGMKYLRYNRMGKDLGIPEEMLKANLMFTSDKLGDAINSAMPKASADWFGAQPPDLSLEARARGADWVYTYLQSFYLDSTRPLGVNNSVLPGASMPHVLWELQGLQKKREHHVEASAGDSEHKAASEHEAHDASPFELVQKGSLSPDEYKKFVGDLTNFMVYAAEPGRNERIARGWKVLAFLLVFFVIAAALKKEYWKDIH